MKKFYLIIAFMVAGVTFANVSKTNNNNANPDTNLLKVQIVQTNENDNNLYCVTTTRIIIISVEPIHTLGGEGTLTTYIESTCTTCYNFGSDGNVSITRNCTVF